MAQSKGSRRASALRELERDADGGKFVGDGGYADGRAASMFVAFGKKPLGVLI